mgnify:CR=1 FL=1
MPTETVVNLNDKYSKYLDKADLTGLDPADLNAFEAALNEIMPRIYHMGLWRDMLTTLTDVDVSSGTYVLAAEYDSILSAILGDNPTIINSVWHDYRLFGEPSTSSTATTLMGGFIDDGYNDGGNRVYRVGPVDSTSTATLLVRRRWVDVTAGTNTVYIPNDATIIKHALLGKLAEDNADVERADYHWGTAQRLMEADLDSYRGGAKPKLHLAPDGIGGGMAGMY